MIQFYQWDAGGRDVQPTPDMNFINILGEPRSLFLCHSDPEATCWDVSISRWREPRFQDHYLDRVAFKGHPIHSRLYVNKVWLFVVFLEHSVAKAN